MSGMNGTTSLCESVGVIDAEPCKLPLLDGKAATDGHAISAQVELPQAGRILQFCRRDKHALSGLLCTAWGLLLRCFTGQERVFFWFQSSSSDNKLLRMTIEDEELLSAYVQSVEDALQQLQRQQHVAQAGAISTQASTSVSGVVNSEVRLCLHDSDRRQLGAKTCQEIPKVSHKSQKVPRTCSGGRTCMEPRRQS